MSCSPYCLKGWSKWTSVLYIYRGRECIVYFLVGSPMHTLKTNWHPQVSGYYLAAGRTLRRHLKWKGHPGGWRVPNLGGLCCSGMSPHDNAGWYLRRQKREWREERINSPITAKRGDGFIYNLGWALFIVSSGRAKGAPAEGTVSEQHPELHSLVLEMVSKRRVGEREGGAVSWNGKKRTRNSSIPDKK